MRDIVIQMNARALEIMLALTLHLVPKKSLWIPVAKLVRSRAFVAYHGQFEGKHYSTCSLPQVGYYRIPCFPTIARERER